MASHPSHRMSAAPPKSSRLRLKLLVSLIFLLLLSIGIGIWFLQSKNVQTPFAQQTNNTPNSPPPSSNNEKESHTPPALGQQDSQPVQPAGPAALLPDNQKLGIWKGHDFAWVDPPKDQERRMTFRLEVPAGHRYVTVVVDTPDGIRVRNLLDHVAVELLGGDPKTGRPQSLVVEWNGLDDWGQPVADGNYRVHGCSLPGLKVTYDYSFYNPGTPPWEHYPMSAWGGPHAFPNAVACVRGHGNKPDAKWRVAIGGEIAEGGDAGFVLNAEHRKVFTFGRLGAGPRALAVANGYLWISVGMTNKALHRVQLHTGTPVPFETPTGKVNDLLFAADISAITIHGKRGAVLLKHPDNSQLPDRLVVFDCNSGENRVILDLPKPTRNNGLAFSKDGSTLYLAAVDGLYRVPAAANPLTLTRLSWVDKPSALALDPDGNLGVMDAGADYRVKVFSTEGKLLREIGTKGGQGRRIEYDHAALHGVEAISFDDDGQLWAAESGATDNTGAGFARRIAVWNAKGEFVRDFIGTTWYGSSCTTLHDQDPTIAYAHGMLYRVDPSKLGSWRPWRYVFEPYSRDAFGMYSNAPDIGFYAQSLFRSKVSGQEREYILLGSGYPVLFHADKSGYYRPIMAIGNPSRNKIFPEVPGITNATHLWTDLNGDGKCQPEEFQRIPGENIKVHHWNGWSYPAPHDLVFRVGGLELVPQKFTDQGVPVYDVSKAKRLQAGNNHYLRVGKHLVSYQHGPWESAEAGYYFAGRYQFSDLNGKVLARYRCNWPGVQGSHRSTLYTPGQTGRTIGELLWAGIADSGGEIGHVIAVQGNKGQAFLFSEDGLFVSTLFRDVREEPQGRGDREIKGADWTNITLHEEPFNGWFGRQSDGVHRYLFGNTAALVTRIEGLDKVTRIKPITVRISGPRGGATNAAVSPITQERSIKVPFIGNREPAFRCNGDPADWADIPRHAIKQGDKVVAQVALAYEADYLWILAEVTDSSPLRNQLSDITNAFKTGDAIDLCIGPRNPDRSQPITGDVRVLLVPGPDKSKVIAYRQVQTGKTRGSKQLYQSPVRKVTFDDVYEIPDAKVVFKPTDQGYLCEAFIPLAQLDLAKATAGLRVRGDLGVLWGNDAGRITERRLYLFNRSPDSTVTADLPTEAALLPGAWGEFYFD